MHHARPAAAAAALILLVLAPAAFAHAWSARSEKARAARRHEAHPKRAPHVRKHGRRIRARKLARVRTQAPHVIARHDRKRHHTHKTHQRRKTHATRRPRPHRATPSFYVRTLSGRKMWRRGCRTATRHASGIVILAFGRPYARRGIYGTQMLGGDFASNRAITTSMKTFVRGYLRCLSRRSRSHIVLARGTSNYSPHVTYHFRAGWRWARETVRFDRYLRSQGVRHRITTAAAVDAEPAWNPGFSHTRAFFRGYAARRPGIPLYNFGSLDGGVGKIWSARQVWYVSSGMRYAHMIPEIYFPGMAKQWAEMSRIAVERYGRPVRFAGVMTQHRTVPRCSCGYWPEQAHRYLLNALYEHPKTRVGRLPITNIAWR
jgi:hypothetical protein